LYLKSETVLAKRNEAKPPKIFVVRFTRASTSPPSPKPAMLMNMWETTWPP
jgi:hypothetical protein